MRRLTLALLAALAVSSPAPAQARLSLVGRFSEPVYVTGVGSRLIVVERRGLLRERGGRVFADLRSRVVKAGKSEMVDQRGLFSVAFPRPYRGRFYVYYVDRRSRLRVDEVRRGRFKRVLDLGVVGLQHHGGQIEFGPDGRLYVSTLGQILRLRIGEAPEVYATGMRNPWRFSFHRGALLIGDVGETDTETVRVVAAGAPPGGVAAPAFTYAQENGRCAVVGGYVWRGRYVYGDVCSGEILTRGLPAFADERPLGKLFYLVSFGRDTRGRLYAVSYGGGVYRVSAEP